MLLIAGHSTLGEHGEKCFSTFMHPYMAPGMFKFVKMNKCERKERSIDGA